ncbi:hypothetical protein PHYPSEUDO_001656 [Phytophthora pseudosyringae]|uniref:LRAT domain-containing protein n=1 Tax=Phytophthora pseudosyringae TaxID=221518 RepID=A0A8T1VUY7_9STRA|nr:hypothetical protein PHYPSEUDO_001656 [Phytophthora pseudosyringae]
MGNVSSRAAKVEALCPGDHIFIWDHTHWLSYQHHGIVWASGNTIEDVRICHVWAPLVGFRQAQTDSSFRLSTLEQFLYHRSVGGLRHPIIQNCEHAARWYKTGRQSCSQTLTPGHGAIPFEDRLRKIDVLALEYQVKAIRKAALVRSTNPLSIKQYGDLRVTLFWLDSFSADIVNVRKEFGRHIFKWPPVVVTIYEKSVIRRSSTDIMRGNSSQRVLQLGNPKLITWSS